VDEQVNALAHKMKAFSLLLIVEVLEFNDPLEKELVSKLELWIGDMALVHDSNGNDEFAIM